MQLPLDFIKGQTPSCYDRVINEYGAQLSGKCLVPTIMINARHAISRLILTALALIEANGTEHFLVVYVLNKFGVTADKWS